MSVTIELPDTVYRELKMVAEERGVNVAECIAAILPRREESPDGRNLLEVLGDAVGSVDSRKFQGPQTPDTPFGEAVWKKLERQGFRRA